MTDPWYEIVAPDQTLLQGDLLLDCPVLRWKPVPAAQQTTETAFDPLSLALGIVQDVVVMTQACDLEQKKVDDVVLCPHAPLSQFRRDWEGWMNSRQQAPSERAWRRTCDDIAAGFVWNQSLLESFEHPEVGSKIRVVDFHQVYTAPRSFLEAFLRHRARLRLRLRPPYREHLSQAFARFFMRVGLPQPVSKTW